MLFFNYLQQFLVYFEFSVNFEYLKLREGVADVLLAIGIGFKDLHPTIDDIVHLFV
jgi:hypothetical protein